MTQKDWFCENIRKNESGMYALAYSILRNQADATEAVSESVYRAYSRLDTLRSKAAFKTWILFIVHNTSIEMLRKSSRTVELEQAEHIEEPESGVDVTTKLALRNAVESLNQPYRTVVVLYYYEDLSVSRIAKITGAQTAAVRQQLSRARKMLREILKEDFNNESI